MDAYSIAIIMVFLICCLTDGANIKEANKSADAKHGLYMMLKSNADMSRGKYLQDFSEDAFMVSESSDLSNYLVANLVLLNSSRLEETGAFEQSYNELLRLNPSKLPAFYGGQVILGLMFHELIYFDDETSRQRARKRIEAKAKDKFFQKLIQMKHPAFLPYHAAKKFFLDGDANKALELIGQARKLTPSLQNPGSEHTVMLLLDRLESRMKEVN